MLPCVLALSNNVYTSLSELETLGRKASTVRAHIDAACATSVMQRDIKRGMLAGALAGTCAAHALLLPYDALVGTGPALAPKTFAYQRDQIAGIHTASHDPHVVYGAARGFVGPLVAVGVGFAAGTCKIIGMLFGAAAGLATSPLLLWYGGHSADFKAHIKHHKQLGGNHSFRLTHAAASMSAALVCDVARGPSLILKCLMPGAGAMLGALFGVVQGLQSLSAASLADSVADSGRRASAISQEGVVLALEVGYLWWQRQAHVGV